MKRIVMDLDDTVSFTTNGDYANAEPNHPVIDRIREYQEAGFTIVFYSSRNVRTYSGNIGKINAFTLPTMIEWLNRNNVPYDEVIVGKPWCGFEGFYVDDKAIRPDEFVELEYEEVLQLIGNK